MTENDYPLRPQGRLPESSGTHRPREFFETIAGPDETPYPEEADSPNVYYARRLKNVRFTEEVGQQELTYETTEDKKFIFNMEAEKYIEEGSIISCWRQNGQWWTIDKVRQEELVIICHQLQATTHSTGTISRLDAVDGSVLWTIELGLDAATGAPKCGYSVDVDSRGNIYVAWQVSNLASGPPFSTPAGQTWPATYNNATGCAAGGIVKLNRNGSILASHTFPARHASFSVGGVILTGHNARIRVDREHDDRIYYTGDYDADGKFLYRFDSDLSPVWSKGPADIDAGLVGRSIALTLTPDGGLFFVMYTLNSSSGKVWKIDASGSLVGSFSPSVLSQGIAVDDSNRLRVAGERSNPGNVFMVGIEADLVTGQWTRTLNDFTMNPPAGSWINGITVTPRDLVFDGGSLLCGLHEPAQWNVTAGGTRYASLLRLSSAGGVVVDARGWGDWTNGNFSSIFGIAHNPVSNATYVAGSANNGGFKLAGRLGGWESQVLAVGSARIAWGIAARTVR